MFRLTYITYVLTHREDVTLNNLGVIGLNQDDQFQDLTSFVTAAGFASASVLYSLPDPPFVHDQYTIAPFELPRDIVANGTLIANTTAVKSESGCLPAQVNMVSKNDGSGGWNNSASSNGCAIAWEVERTSVNLFGVDLPGCAPAPTPQFSPIVFWFFTCVSRVTIVFESVVTRSQLRYEPTPRASATFCFPTLSLWDVNVNVDLATANLTQVTEIRPFSSSSNFSSLSANVTGAPLFGHAYNGIQFNLSANPDPFVQGRQTATRLQLPAAVFQEAVQSTQGLLGSFDADRFVDLSTRVYTTYLSLIARNVYFLPHKEPLTVQLRTFQNRVWLSSTAVHLLAVAMLLLAFFGSIVHLFHRSDRRKLRLRHEPGTIASAVSIGAQTGMGNLLAGHQDEKEFAKALSNKKFRIDPQKMKIIMEGEDGYEFAASPMERRKSVFAALQAQRRLSKRFSAWSKPSSMPNSPLAHTLTSNNV
ncbi:hypothetical protein DXG01_001181 [Tephrocybe rancida]|nr:hypothetical protein DXG01_001181 [Tephrocybe rancida]